MVSVPVDLMQPYWNFWFCIYHAVLFLISFFIKIQYIRLVLHPMHDTSMISQIHSKMWHLVKATKNSLCVKNELTLIISLYPLAPFSDQSKMKGNCLVVYCGETWGSTKTRSSSNSECPSWPVSQLTPVSPTYVPTKWVDFLRNKLFPDLFLTRGNPGGVLSRYNSKQTSKSSPVRVRYGASAVC